MPSDSFEQLLHINKPYLSPVYHFGEVTQPSESRLIHYIHSLETDGHGTEALLEVRLTSALAPPVIGITGSSSGDLLLTRRGWLARGVVSSAPTARWRCLAAGCFCGRLVISRNLWHYVERAGGWGSGLNSINDRWRTRQTWPGLENATVEPRFKRIFISFKIQIIFYGQIWSNDDGFSTNTSSFMYT